jgi:hypothetical protein
VSQSFLRAGWREPSVLERATSVPSGMAGPSASFGLGRQSFSARHRLIIGGFFALHV